MVNMWLSGSGSNTSQQNPKLQVSLGWNHQPSQILPNLFASHLPWQLQTVNQSNTRGLLSIPVHYYNIFSASTKSMLSSWYFDRLNTVSWLKQPIRVSQYIKGLNIFKAWWNVPWKIGQADANISWRNTFQTCTQCYKRFIGLYLQVCKNRPIFKINQSPSYCQIQYADACFHY